MQVLDGKNNLKMNSTWDVSQILHFSNIITSLTFMQIIKPSHTHNDNNNSECILFFPVFSSQVFKEMLEFDVSDAFGVPKDDGHFWWPGLSSKRRRRSSVFPWHWDITKDARFAFTVRTHTRFLQELTKKSPPKKKKKTTIYCES